MTPIAALLLLALLCLAVPMLLLGAGPDRESESSRFRRAAEREAGRQEMERHPVERGDWRCYRSIRPSRLSRWYTTAWREGQ